MTENLIFNLQDLFEEIVAEGIAQGVNTEEAYHQLIDDVIEDHRRVKEIHDDQSTESYETQLKARWPEFRDRLAS